MTNDTAVEEGRGLKALLALVFAFLLAAVCLVWEYLNSHLGMFLWRPRRNHFPDCKCDSIGTKIASVSKLGYDNVLVQNAAKNPNAPLVVYFHGNKRTICACTHMTKHLDFCDVLLFDYRNFGRSKAESAHSWYDDDRCSETKITWDVYQVLSAVIIERRGKPVYAYAHSLGCAALVTALRNYSVHLLTEGLSGVILEGPPFRLSECAPRWARPIAKLFSIDGKYPVAVCVPEIKVPLLVIHSVDDKIVPFAQGRALAECHRNGPHARRTTRLVELTGPHNAPHYDESFKRAIKEFVGLV